MDTIYIGYFSKEPIPEGSSDNTEAVAFLNKLRTHPKVEIIQYKGFSLCRCCDNTNGSQELIIELDKKYVIPEGYIHYLRDHKIEVDPNLLTLMEKLAHA